MSVGVIVRDEGCRGNVGGNSRKRPREVRGHIE